MRLLFKCGLIFLQSLYEPSGTVSGGGGVKNVQYKKFKCSGVDFHSNSSIIENSSVTLYNTPKTFLLNRSPVSVMVYQKT